MERDECLLPPTSARTSLFLEVVRCPPSSVTVLLVLVLRETGLAIWVGDLATSCPKESAHGSQEPECYRSTQRQPFAPGGASQVNRCTDGSELPGELDGESQDACLHHLGPTGSSSDLPTLLQPSHLGHPMPKRDSASHLLQGLPPPGLLHQAAVLHPWDPGIRSTAVPSPLGTVAVLHGQQLDLSDLCLKG
jgi:hypothetical protein